MLLHCIFWVYTSKWESQVAMEKNSMELLTFPPELNYIAGIFPCYPKYIFIYIFLNATVLVKKPQNKKTKQKTPNPQVPTNPEICKT